MNLHNFDLNLLTIFDMIFTERHLTKAGKILNMSQPAMSQALKKLRESFGDPLFVRVGNELVPTDSANRLAPLVKQMMDTAKSALLDKGEFDPANSSRTFQLAMSDYTEMILLPKLFKKVREMAPSVKLQSRHLPLDDYRSMLESHDIDLILGCSLDFGANTYQQALFEDEEIIVVRTDSKAANEPLTIESLLELKHAQFKGKECPNILDSELACMDLERVIVLEVQHELVLPIVIQNNDVAINMPRRMAEIYQEMLPITILELPFTVTKYQFCQHWHERNHQDPASKWLRREVNEIAKEL